MAEQLKEESQKTVVSFIVGLLVGGLLVWAFTGNNPEDKKTALTEDDKKEIAAEVEKDKEAEMTKTETKSKTMPVGDGAATVGETKAGMSVPLTDVTFPTKEGWVGVRNLNEGQLGLILGVVRFSEEQGLVPKEITLQTPTVAGREYAVVFYSENGDRKFNLANDVQIDKQFATFTAK